MSKTRAHYSKDFKAHAVEKVAGGELLTRTANELGISAGVLSKWVRSTREASGEAGAAEVAPSYVELEARLKRVERALEVLRKIVEENFLEKARREFPAGPGFPL